MKKMNLNQSNASVKPLTFEEQVQYFQNELSSGTYSPEKEFLIVNKKGHILHGDALFEACELLNVAVCFAIVKNEHVDFVLQYSSVFSGLMNEEVYISPAEVINSLKYKN